MKMEYYTYLLTGLIVVAGINNALAKPSHNDHYEYDGMQSDDDYQYNDDEEAPSNGAATVSSLKSTEKPFFEHQDIVRSVRPGQNVTLDCSAKNLEATSSVILWYKGENVLTNGASVTNPAYKLDLPKYSLVIVNATEENKGDYYCEILPHKARLHISLDVSEEQSTANSTSGHGQVLPVSLLVSSLFGILLFLRI